MHASCLLAGGRFEAARRVAGDEHRLHGLHGHSFRVLARADVTHIEQAELQTALARYWPRSTMPTSTSNCHSATT
jgi:6-pyruvoyltetrahydropterin/6-carboxytetrahydropterin synthase